MVVVSVDKTSHSTRSFGSHYGTLEVVQLGASEYPQLQAGMKGHVEGVGVLQLRALRQCGSAAAAWGVAKDVDKLRLSLDENVLGTVQGKHIEGIGLQRLCLIGSAVLLKCKGDGLKCIMTGQQTRSLVGFEPEDTLTQAIQLQDIRPQSIRHAVVDDYLATANLHEVFLTRARVIIIFIAFAHLHLYGVSAVKAEHGIAEGVFHTVVFQINQRNLCLITAHRCGCVDLVAEIVKGIITHLSVGYLHGSVIYVVVAVVVDFCRLIDSVAIHTNEGALMAHGVGYEAVGQVDDLAHLSVLEQSGIAVAVHLLDLPAYRRKHEHVLTGQGVGLYLHTLALHIGYSIVTSSTGVLEGEALARLAGIEVVIHQP